MLYRVDPETGDFGSGSLKVSSPVGSTSDEQQHTRPGWRLRNFPSNNTWLVDLIQQNSDLFLYEAWPTSTYNPKDTLPGGSLHMDAFF